MRTIYHPQVESVRKLKSEILQNQMEELSVVKTQLNEAAALAVTAYQTSSDTELVYIRQNLQLAISKIQVKSPEPLRHHHNYVNYEKS